MVRTAAFLRVALSLEKAISMGLRSGRIRRQIEQGCAGLFDGGTNAGDLVGGQVIHDDDVARRQLGHQHVGHIGAEGVPVHRPIEQHGRAQAAQAQAGGEGRGLPMAMGDGGPAALSALGPAPQAGHFGRGAGLIDEDEFFGIKIGLSVEPSLAASGDVRPLWLGGVRGFF